MSTIAKVAVQRVQVKAWKMFRFFTLAIFFGVVEVLAARELDGWLSLALWGIAAYNVGLLILALVGLVLIAAEALRKEQAS